MQVAYMMVFLLISYAMMELLGIKLTDVIKVKDDEEIHTKAQVELQKKQKKLSLKAHKKEIEACLQVLGGKTSWETYLRIVIGVALTGFTIGLATNNVALAIVLFAGFAMMPYLFFQIRTRSYRNTLHNQMEQAIAIITNNYIQVPDALAATLEALKTTADPMYTILNTFCTEVRANVSTEEALRRMRPKIDDRYWREWIDRMMQCQTNSSLRPMLAPIPKTMSEQRQQQMELDTITRKIWAEHLVVAGLSIGAIPFIIVINKDWGTALTTTPLGKAAIAIDVFIVFVGTIYAYVVNKPLYAEV